MCNKKEVELSYKVWKMKSCNTFWQQIFKFVALFFEKKNVVKIKREGCL